MVKLIYLALVILALLPCVFVAVACVQSTRGAKQIQRDQQSRTTNSVYVVPTETTIGFGRVGVRFYPRGWAGILVLVGFLLFFIGLLFLFFVRL